MTATTNRTRTFSWEDPRASLAGAEGLSGIEYMSINRATGAIPPPPIARLMDMDLIEVTEGRAVFGVTPAEWMFNPIGSVHGGIAATLLDSCMGCAVHSTLPAGVGYTTTDLQVRYLRGVDEHAGRLLAEGAVTHTGRRQATAEGRLIVEATGKVVATATTGCMVLGG